MRLGTCRPSQRGISIGVSILGDVARFGGCCQHNEMCSTRYFEPELLAFHDGGDTQDEYRDLERFHHRTSGTALAVRNHDRQDYHVVGWSVRRLPRPLSPMIGSFMPVS